VFIKKLQDDNEEFKSSTYLDEDEE